MKLSYTLLLLTASLLMTGSAQAASVSKRFSATSCAYDVTLISGYKISPSTIANGTSSYTLEVFCPLTDPSTVDGIAVDGFDANNDPTYGIPTAKICQGDNLGTVISCTSSYALLGGTSTGAYSTWLPSSMISVLKDPARTYWYADLVISIPRVGIYGGSILRGFFRT